MIGFELTELSFVDFDYVCIISHGIPIASTKVWEYLI